MERYVVFNPDTSEVLSIPNYKPESGSYIEVDPQEVKDLLLGVEPMSYYYVHFSKLTKKYELRLRLNNNIDSYNVNDLIYEIPKRKKANADVTITQNIKDTCWKIRVDGDLKASILAQKVSSNYIVSFSITKVNDPNILYKTLELNQKNEEKEFRDNEISKRELDENEEKIQKENRIKEEQNKNKLLGIEKDKKYGIQNFSCVKDEFGLVTISGQFNNNEIKKDKVILEILFLDYEQNIIFKNNANLLEIDEFETKRFLGNTKIDKPFFTCTITQNSKK